MTLSAWHNLTSSGGRVPDAVNRDYSDDDQEDDKEEEKKEERKRGTRASQSSSSGSAVFRARLIKCSNCNKNIASPNNPLTCIVSVFFSFFRCYL